MAKKRAVIVGGVAGGATCAARLRRLDEEAEIIVLERGPYVSLANCGFASHLSCAQSPSNSNPCPLPICGRSFTTIFSLFSSYLLSRSIGKRPGIAQEIGKGQKSLGQRSRVR